jgi:hypothetical protein
VVKEVVGEQGGTRTNDKSADRVWMRRSYDDTTPHCCI